MASRWAKYISDEEGSATVEICLILPVFLAIIGLIIDSSMLFFRQGQAFQVVQDANRSLSVGRFASTAEAEDYIVAALGGVAPSISATSVVDAGIVTTTVSMPASELQVTGMLGAFDETSVVVTASHMVEQ